MMTSAANFGFKWFRKVTLVPVVMILSGLFTAGSALADITVYDKDDKFVKLSGNIQLQYHTTDPEDGASTDEILFRRLQPGIEAGLFPDWTGKIVWEMGKSRNDNEVELKDIYLQYSGFKPVLITAGNFIIPFSREMMTSSKRQQLVERTFVGDHNYGTPARNTGIGISTSVFEKKLEFAAAAAKGAIDPDAKKLDFESPVIWEDDFNEGWMAAGRVDFHPFGPLKMAQGDFDGKLKATLGVAGFVWNNDDDNNTYTEDGADHNLGKKPDVDSVTGIEISGAVRIAGASLDAQYNRFHAETIDAAISSGIYENGETDLENMAVEGGYMVIPAKLEAVAGYEFQDADGYDKTWSRTSFGLNYFFREHDIKLQMTYRLGENLDGNEGNDADEMFIQAQYVF